MTAPHREDPAVEALAEALVLPPIESQRRLFGDGRLPASFWLRVRVEGDCWIAAKDRDRYGSVWSDGRRCVAHRYVYEALIGPISPGLQLDHRCRVPACCNPAHLEAVTQLENILRGLSPRLLMNGGGVCRNERHPWPESASLSRDGRLRCQACARERQARYKRRADQRRTCPVCGEVRTNIARHVRTHEEVAA